MVAQSGKCHPLFYMTNVNVSHLCIKKVDHVKLNATISTT